MTKRPTAPKAFGPQLRKAREARGLGLSELARAAGVDKTYLSRVENGERPLQFIHLPDLLRGLGVNPYDPDDHPDEQWKLLRSAFQEADEDELSQIVFSILRESKSANACLRLLGIASPRKLETTTVTKAAAIAEHVREELRGGDTVAVDVHRADGTTRRIVALDRLRKEVKPK